MRTITVTNLKGGVAKTTTSWFLAAAARRRNEWSVLLIDLNVETASSYDWWYQLGLKGHRDEDMLVVQAPDPKDPVGAVKEFLPEHWDLDRTVVIFDCPPGNDLIIQGAMELADVIIVPTTTNPADVRQAPATLELADRVNAERRREAEREIPVVALPVKVRTQVNEAKEIGPFLQKAGFLLPRNWIADRIDIARAYGHMPGHLFGYLALWDELEVAFR